MAETPRHRDSKTDSKREIQKERFKKRDSEPFSSAFLCALCVSVVGF
jgi:hypothetical protein